MQKQQNAPKSGSKINSKNSGIERKCFPSDSKGSVSPICYPPDSALSSPVESWWWSKSLPGFGVRTLPSGTRSYVVQYRIRGKKLARRVIGRVGEIDQRAAWRRARKILATHQVEQRLHDPLAPATIDARMTLRAFADQHWPLMARGWKPATARQNRRLLDSHILPALGRRRMDKLTRADILAWRSDLAHMPATADRTVPVLSGLLQLAETLRFRPEGSNPARRIRRYRSKTTQVTRFLTAEELQRLGEALTAFDAEAPMVCDMIRLLLLTGCRSGEIQGVHWDQVDGSFLHLPDSKSGASTRFLGKPARDILCGYRERAEMEDRYARNAPVFSDPANGKPVRIAFPLWDRIRTAAGLPDARLHDLRHSFASHAAMLRINLPTIQTLLGHRTIENSAIYAHLGDDSVRAANDRVAALITDIARLELVGEGA